MKRMNSLFKPISLAMLLLTLGSGVAVAAEPAAQQTVSPAEVQSASPNEIQPTATAEIIRLAWDRVGGRASIMMI
ncbi:MAG: hypothetical protein R6W97_06715 [Thiobacillus sp.]